jgi:hypothetical protein
VRRMPIVSGEGIFHADPAPEPVECGGDHRALDCQSCLSDMAALADTALAPTA